LINYDAGYGPGARSSYTQSFTDIAFTEDKDLYWGGTFYDSAVIGQDTLTPKVNPLLPDAFVYRYENFNPTGFKEKPRTDDFAFTLYPNPASHQVRIRSGEPLKGAAQISLLNGLGQVLNHYSLEGRTKTISVNSLKQGIYYLRVKTEETTVTKKFVKD